MTAMMTCLDLVVALGDGGDEFFGCDIDARAVGGEVLGEEVLGLAVGFSFCPRSFCCDEVVTGAFDF